MKNDVKHFQSLVAASTSRIKADLVIKNAKVVNVFSHEIINGDIAIQDGVFVGVGKYEGEKEIDIQGKYVTPGLIDAHVHIESSSVTPKEFAKAVLPRGVTTVVADPHEIANVLGLKGIKYMLEASKELPLNCYYMLPSCVPSTSYETAGAILNAEELQAFINNDKILGLGELMNYPGVISGNSEIMKKVSMAHKAHKFIDGHGPVIKNKELNAYKVVGIRTDHECTNTIEMLEQLRVGMYIAMREGSACKDVLNLIGAVNSHNERRVLFCTDDRHPGDLLRNGSIDNNIRLAIGAGVDPITAIRMATLNTAECYQLNNIGAIAPGYEATFLIVDDISNFYVKQTYIKGQLINDAWADDVIISDDITKLATNTVNVSFAKDDFKIPLTKSKVNIIKINADTIVTKHITDNVNIVNGCFEYNPNKDVVPYYVLERHFGTGNIGKGLLNNMNLHNGAIATTISHDSHNLGLLSTSVENSLLAIKTIIEIGGGVVLVKDGKVIGKVALPIAGLMSDLSMDIVAAQFDELYRLTYESLGINRSINSLIALSFMALPVIPELKLTDQGLFDVLKFEHIELEVT